MVFPLLYIWIFYQIPVSIPQMLLIVVYPTLSLLSKLKGLWWDYFQIRFGTDTKKKLKSKSKSRIFCIVC